MSKSNINPFLLHLKIDVVRVTKTKHLIDAENREEITLDYYEYGEGKLFERQKCTKWYKFNGVDDLTFYQLKGRAKDLLWYIMNHIGTDKDRIVLKIDKVSELLQCSKPTVISAIRNLCECSIITKAERQSVYWVNIYHIFSGNRIKFIKKVKNDCLNIVDYQ